MDAEGAGEVPAGRAHGGGEVAAARRAEEWAMPAATVERARRFAAQGTAPVPLRTAATVVLLRAPAGPDQPPAGAGPAPVEVYLVRRAATMAFAAGMYAFPGGSVDPVDLVDPVDGAGETLDGAERLRLPPAQAAAVVRAAVREVFEESGVRLDPKLLVPWSRWVTPEFEPRRFDAYFFVAALPPGQLAEALGGEADHSMWLPAAEAVARCQAGEIGMLPPTLQTLRELAGYPSVRAVLAAAVGRDAATPVRPRVDLVRGLLYVDG